MRHTAGGGSLAVVVLDVGDAFRVEVIDGGGVSGRSEVLLLPDAAYGRGLFLVDGLARNRGTWLDVAGRTTWFEIDNR